jgi:UDPglucose--hexose-1-phosphate uridylyltransferase
VPAGLFELRKDAITGWWVATIVDREFDRERFRRTAEPIDDGGHCRNCLEPDGGAFRRRMLKDFAFDVVGTEADVRERADTLATRTLGEARAAGSWSTVLAPPGEHRPIHEAPPATVRDLLAAARAALAAAAEAGATDYLTVVQNWGAQAGARTNHLCLDLYDLPQVPHRIGEEIGGSARFVIREGECPFCRLVRDEVRHGARLVWQDSSSVAFAPFASRSPFEVWIVARRHEADFARASDADLASTADALRAVLGQLASLDGPPYNLVLHTAPLRERVDQTYHWHWELHPRLREIAGLELGTGLPVNPVAPEDAVEELRRAVGRESGTTALAAVGGRDPTAAR